MPVFANMKQMINVMANLAVTSNQVGCNNDCYNKFRRNRCYDEAGRIDILLRILRADVKVLLLPKTLELPYLLTCFSIS